MSSSLDVSAKIYPVNRYLELYNRSLEDPERFWEEQARELDWFRSWDRVLEWNPPFAKWFVGGRLNACYNALDRHLKSWRKNKAALIWEGEPGERRVLTYHDLYREANRFADALLRLGVKTGDRVGIYMPLIPELPISMLAASRIGATFTVVFSGFSAGALADRLNDAEAKVLITADGGYRRGRIVNLKENADKALASCPTVEHVVVYRRTGHSVPFKEGRDIWWDDIVKDSRNYVEPVSVESNHPLYILYTSGTTGKPKGVVHSTGGYLVYVSATQKWVFDVRDDDVYWCTADIGWVTGHSYVVYGPFLNGVTTVMYEGALDYPNPGRWWEIVERYGVTILYTTPTALRTLIKYGDEYPKKYNLSSLRLLGTVGEPINPAAWEWYFNVVGGGRCPIVDTWWQTETGGILISPAPRLGLVPLKPGSATYPLPTILADVYDEKGRPAPSMTRGYLVIKNPWPGMLQTLFKDPQRYQQVYWSRFEGVYYTGDYAMKDGEGYFWLLGRADEVLKVAGHRLGTIELEDALVSHQAVAEAAVVGRPDAVKGEVIVVFATLKQGYSPSPQLAQELREHVRRVIGPIATPEEIHFVKMLPKTRSGKIMRRVIKAVASQAEIGDITTLEDEAS
ncbi:MAG: acetate--CoA ligase, partial [Nitrososphaerota archaeon]